MFYLFIIPSIKTKLGIIALGALCLFLAGCGNGGNTNKNAEVNVNECKKGCEIISNDEGKKTDCYNLCETSKKLESADINDCDDIENTSNNLVTKDICIQDKAIQSKNPKYCENIENIPNKHSCYLGLAKRLKDESLCKKVENEIIKSACKEEVGK